jgi:hypothetical protein
MSVRKFILVVEEDVVTDMTLPYGPKFEHITHALSNNPKFIEVPADSEIDQGWVWNGIDFLPPEE